MEEEGEFGNPDTRLVAGHTWTWLQSIEILSASRFSCPMPIITLLNCPKSQGSILIWMKKKIVNEEIVCLFVIHFELLTIIQGQNTSGKCESIAGFLKFSALLCTQYNNEFMHMLNHFFENLSQCEPRTEPKNRLPKSQKERRTHMNFICE